MSMGRAEEVVGRAAAVRSAGELVTPPLGGWLFRPEGTNYWLRDEGVEIGFEDLQVPRASVLRLGPSAAWVIADPKASLPEGVALRITIRAQGRVIGPIAAYVTPTRGAPRGAIAGVAFVRVPEGSAAELRALLHDLERRGRAEPALPSP